MMRPSRTPAWRAATMFARALMVAVAAGSLV